MNSSFHGFLAGYPFAGNVTHQIQDQGVLLDAAIQQIDDILRSRPFMPEEFGFKAVVQDGRMLYFKDEFSIGQSDTDSSHWIIMRDADKAIDLFITNAMIGKIVLTSLGVLDREYEPVTQEECKELCPMCQEKGVCFLNSL
jgi:hypothetical protein